MAGDILTYLKSRGVVAGQTHPELDEFLSKNKVTLYAGFDPTGESLHVGNLFVIITLRRFQKFGHRPIALVGGGTSLVGDPSGREKERTLQSVEEIRRRSELIRAELSRFLKFGDGPSDALLLDNYDWLSRLDLIEFLRDIGKHFRLQDMIARESVKRRLEKQEGLSFTEFSYQLLQAYDFLHQFRHYHCVLQVGGSDQWGNITAGSDLIRTMTGKPAFGVTTHLITRTDGSKFGKSDDGQDVIWLNPEKTKPFDFYQYWLGTDDRDVLRYVLAFTEVAGAELDELKESLAKEPEKHAAHRRLAFEVTKLVHGEETAKEAEEAAKAVFGRKGDTGSVDSAPTTEIEKEDLAKRLSIADAFVLSGLLESKSEVRRKAAAGAVWVNDGKIEDANSPLEGSHFDAAGRCLLRFGKKKIHFLKLKSGS